MNYPLESLGPNRFQQLCQSLLSKSFPEAQCFPVLQRDGGRDATLMSNTASIKESVLFQVKYTKNALKVSQPHKNIVDELRKELPRYANRINSEATKYVLITNVAGTAMPDTGSIDAVQKLLDKHISIPAQCWWRNEIERRLDDAWNIKWSFPEVLSNQDILRAIVERELSEDAERRTTIVRAFVRDQFDYDVDVRFKQVDLQNKLLDLFMDVPIDLREHLGSMQSNHRERRALFGIARKHNSSRHPSNSRLGAATVFLDPIAQRDLPRVVLEGAPGQGKSTIVQYLCQIHRGRLLNEEEFSNRIPEKHRNSPIRLPFKIDCRDFALWLSGKNPFQTEGTNETLEIEYRSLESFVAKQMEVSSGGARFDVSDVQAVVKRSPILCVFDGLDEVADVKERRRVVEEISKGTRRMQELAVSLQTIVTSRPTTFANSPGLPPSSFLYLQLSSIDRATIAEYAKKWVAARGLRERDAKEVQTTLDTKLDQPHLRDLARNPMQLTILLSLIHRKGSSLPDKRTALYDSYINLFFDREAEKSDVVRDQRLLLIDIHRYLAWVLHSESQTKQTAGRIESDRLKDVVREFLVAGKHGVQLVEDLFTGVVERVVALVSRIEGSYEFEVQPMREYFAARYLYDTAPYSPAGDVKPGTLPERFEALAGDFFWQNVTRFYAGCYSQGQLPSLLQSLGVLANEDKYKNSCYPQSLGITLLSDYTFAQYPLIVEGVVDFVLASADFRLIVAGEQYAARGDSLYLPKGSGKQRLVDKCFEELEQQPEVDYAQTLVETIRTNTLRQERVDPWWSALEKIEDREARTRWIIYGSHLGVFENADQWKINSLLEGNDIEYRKRLLNFAFSRMWAYISKNKKYATDAVEILLGQTNEFTFQPKGGLIQAFSGALSSQKYLIAFREKSAASLSRVWQHYPFFAARDQEKLPQEGDYEIGILKNCCRFLQESHHLSEKFSATAWASELAPWERLIEKGRQLFGNRWAFCALACSAAGIRSREENCEEASNLFDVDVPIARRARHARLKAGRWKWWSEHLALASGQMEIAFLLLLVFCWAGRTVILRLKNEIEEKLSELELEWWQKVFKALNSQIWFNEHRRAISVDPSELGDSVSERMVVAMMQRATGKAKKSLFHAYLSEYMGDDPVVLEVCQEVAIAEAVNGDMDELRRKLPSISDRYQRGVRSFTGRHPWAFMTHRESMSLKLAERIVEESEKYPMVLLTIAEQVRRASIAERVVPVGEVADNQKWFNC